jgi:hypothetical protein
MGTRLKLSQACRRIGQKEYKKGLFSSFAQQVTGTLGEPGATTTIDGKRLRPPPLPLRSTNSNNHNP